MVQEISSKGRGKIQNKWYLEKISAEKRRELKAVFEDILSRVLDDLTWDGLLERKTGNVVERKAERVVEGNVERFDVKSDGDRLVAKFDDDERYNVESFEVVDDESLEIYDDESLVVEISGDEVFNIDVE